MTIALYNEIDPFAADTLENLIDAGLIAPGIVDRRSIEDLTPEYLSHFTQVHFFAGIGVWSHALRQAGVSDDTPLWTGSCPCQPFSSAGKGDGFDDERHLWPAWFWLIEQCRPERLFGEQVASKDTNPWVALVQADLEGLGYAFGAVPFTAAGVGAPNIRERLYWVADSYEPRLEGRQGGPRGPHEQPLGAGRLVSGMAYTNGGQSGAIQSGGQQRFGPQDDRTDERLADTDLRGREQEPNPERARILPEVDGEVQSGQQSGHDDSSANPSRGRSTDHGFWGTVDWLWCRDARWRPVEPGTFPLAHGLARGMGSLDARLSELAGVADLDAASLRDAKSYRVGALKAYGNAINAVAATEFIRACLTTTT